MNKCPFCGNTKHDVGSKSSYFYSQVLDKNSDKQYTHFLCRKCFSKGPGENNENDAVQSWNNVIEHDSEFCPFCGSDEFSVESNNKNKDSPFIYFVSCNNCKAFGPSGCSKNEALKRWKTRDKSDHHPSG